MEIIKRYTVHDSSNRIKQSGSEKHKITITKFFLVLHLQTNLFVITPHLWPINEEEGVITF